MNTDHEPTVTTEYGAQHWFDENGELHRDGDLPAVVWANGHQEWYQHGKRHRDNDLPAIVDTNWYQAWYQNGMLHRDGDQPAVVKANGDQEWWHNGERHRESGPAVISAGGKEEYWLHGARVHGTFMRVAARLRKEDPQGAALFLTMYQNGWTGTAVQLRNTIRAIFAPIPTPAPPTSDQYEMTPAGQYPLFAS